MEAAFRSKGGIDGGQEVMRISRRHWELSVLECAHQLTLMISRNECFDS